MRIHSQYHDCSAAGFSLVIVIWIVGLLAVVLAGVTALMRSHVRQAATRAPIAIAEAAADAGVNLAIIDLVAARLDRGRQRRFAPDGRVVACTMPAGGWVAIRVGDEAGKIDINQAEARLIGALLAGIGLEPAAARTAAARLLDFRDGDDVTRTGGAERSAYRAAGRTGGPKNAPFDAIEELAQVLGFEGGLAMRLAPYVTVHTGLTGVDPAAAGPMLRALLAEGDRTMLTGAAAGTIGLAAHPDTLPPELAAVSPARVFMIRSLAVSGPATRVVRDVVVDLAASRGQTYAILRWQRATLSQAELDELLAASAAPAPPC